METPNDWAIIPVGVPVGAGHPVPSGVGGRAGGLGASLGPALLLSLYWRRVTRWGVWAGMVVGTATSVAWRLWLKEPTGPCELIPAFFGSVATVTAVSVLGPAASRPAAGGR